MTQYTSELSSFTKKILDLTEFGKEQQESKFTTVNEVMYFLHYHCHIHFYVTPSYHGWFWSAYDLHTNNYYGNSRFITRKNKIHIGMYKACIEYAICAIACNPELNNQLSYVSESHLALERLCKKHNLEIPFFSSTNEKDYEKD